MTNTQWEMLLSPSSTDCMKITGAHTACFNLDVNVVITEWLGLEIIQVEFGPFLWVLNLETFERIGVNHDDGR